MLPSLEDLMDQDMDFGMAMSMDMDTFSLGLTLKKTDSLADLINDHLTADAIMA